MAQKFSSAVLTDSGADLLARAQLGECSITFTKVELGSGTHTDKSTAALKIRTSLIAPQQEFPFVSYTKASPTILRLRATFSNEELQSGYYINEIGIFAQETGDSTTEVLYSIAVVANEPGEYYPPYDGVNPILIYQTFAVIVSNTDCTQVTLNPDFLLIDTGGITGNAGDIVTAQALVDASHAHMQMYKDLVIGTTGTLTASSGTTSGGFSYTHILTCVWPGMEADDNVESIIISGTYTKNLALAPASDALTVYFEEVPQTGDVIRVFRTRSMEDPYADIPSPGGDPITVVSLAESLAPMERDPTADNPYDTGRLMMFNGRLYKASEPVSPGDTLEVGENIEETSVDEVISEISNSAKTLLALEYIPDTVQTPVFDLLGNIQSVVHSSGGITVRTDTYTEGVGTVTEVRTLASGESLTIVTDLTTFVTTVTYAAA